MEDDNFNYQWAQNEEQPPRRNVPRWSVDRGDYRTELTNQITQIKNLKNSSKLNKINADNRERELIDYMLNKTRKDQTVLEYERRRAEQEVVQENLMKVRLLNQSRQPKNRGNNNSIKIPIVGMSRNYVQQNALTYSPDLKGINNDDHRLKINENSAISSSVERMNKATFNRSEQSDDDDPMMKQSENSELQLMNTFKRYQNKIDSRAAAGLLQQTKMLKEKLSTMMINPYQQKSDVSNGVRPNYNAVLEAQIQQKKMEKLLSRLQDQEYRTRIEARNKYANDFEKNYQAKQHQSKLEYYSMLKDQVRDQIKNK